MKEDPPAAPIPGLFELFTVFATISLYGFGGVLAWTHRFLVDQRRWLSNAEFNDLFALAQFLPGPNIVNLSVVFGSRLRGWPGALMALGGLLGPPVIIVIALGAIYAHYGEIDALRRVLAAVAAAAAGMLISVTIKLARPLFRWPLGPGPLIAVAAFVAVGVMRWPLIWVLLVMLPASIAVTYIFRRSIAR